MKLDMKRLLVFLYSFVVSVSLAFADYSDHGKPWDADENYDSSHGIWFALLLLGICIIVFVGAAAKHTWDNHKDSIKDGFGIIAFFGGCILLFLAGKACSEQHRKDNGHAVPIRQDYNSSPQNRTTKPSNQNVIPGVNVDEIRRQSQPHYRTEYYDERCSQCNGSGSIVCSYCGGKGFSNVTCSNCSGRGSHHVRKTAQNVFDDSWDTYETDEMCMACFGKGSVEKRCIHCNSDYPYGNSLISTYMTCPSCHGQGIFHKSRQVPY